MVALTPDNKEAYATPCAWFPAEEQITPLDFSTSFNDIILFNAPLNLYAPVNCKFSHFI